MPDRNIYKEEVRSFRTRVKLVIHRRNPVRNEYGDEGSPLPDIEIDTWARVRDVRSTESGSVADGYAPIILLRRIFTIRWVREIANVANPQDLRVDIESGGLDSRAKSFPVESLREIGRGRYIELSSEGV